ncbi:MAG: TraB/GumN family protein [Deltaproteobacteria bacterium]|jgi:uncharacterized protein YbaP (TraB family)|nr:TraB/GumN family protein [Deltaproteobacteria bacterium]
MFLQKSRTLFFFLAFVLLSALAITATPVKASFLWSIEDNNGHQIYLLGSIHLAKPEIYPLNQTILDAFGRSKRLVVEANVDVDTMTQLTIAKELTEKGTYPPDQDVGLWERLDAETTAELKDVLGKLNLFEVFIDQVRPKPWYLAMMLEMMFLESLGFDAKLGVDIHFLKLAKAKGMKIHELESVYEQFSFVSSLTEEESLIFLKSTLVEYEKLKSGAMDELLDIWSGGDAQAFEELYFQAYDEHPEWFALLDKIIYKRNETMYERLQPFFRINDEVSFVVVGSAHLVGPKGLVAMFEKNGFKVTQL